MRRVFFSLGLMLTALPASQVALAETASTKTWLGIAAGPPASAESMLAADIARLFPPGAAVRALPVLGDSGAGNLALMLGAPSVNMAFVSADALAEAAEQDKGFSGKLDLILRLPPQELHILARSGIGPARLDAGDYPNLIEAGAEVPTVATGMVLLAAKARKQASPETIDGCVASLFSRFGELHAEGRHPKWREVNLAATLPGFKRNRGAEARLAARHETRPAPIAASAAGPALSGTPITGAEQEALCNSSNGGAPRSADKAPEGNRASDGTKRRLIGSV